MKVPLYNRNSSIELCKRAKNAIEPALLITMKLYNELEIQNEENPIVIKDVTFPCLR